jgi:hypothetical protein
MTEQDLLTRYHGDRAYVQLVIDDAVAKRRFAPDALCPNDKSKTRYWVCAEESMSFKEGLALETSLTSTFAVTQDDALQLTSDGGVFSSALSQLGTHGFSNSSVANAYNDFFMGSGLDAPAAKSALKSKPKKGDHKKGSDSHASLAASASAGSTPGWGGTR